MKCLRFRIVWADFRVVRHSTNFMIWAHASGKGIFLRLVSLLVEFLSLKEFQVYIVQCQENETKYAVKVKTLPQKLIF